MYIKYNYIYNYKLVFSVERIGRNLRNLLTLAIETVPRIHF